MGGISSERLQIFFKANIFLKNKLFLNCEDDFLHFLAALLKSLLLQMSSSLRRGKYQPSSWIISSFKSPPLSFASRQHSQLLCKSLLRKNIKQLANTSLQRMQHGSAKVYVSSVTVTLSSKPFT